MQLPYGRYVRRSARMWKILKRQSLHRDRKRLRQFAPMRLREGKAVLCELGLELAAGLAIFGIDRQLNNHPRRGFVGHIGEFHVDIAIPVFKRGKLQIRD